MDILLDTHVFLWFVSGDERLPSAMKDRIRDPENDVYLSVVSLWETIVKYRLGKLPLPNAPDRYLPMQRKRHQIASLPLDETSVSCLARLPSIHRDPFDRIMICQAITHDMIFATVDKTVLRYPAAFLPRL